MLMGFYANISRMWKISFDVVAVQRYRVTVRRTGTLHMSVGVITKRQLLTRSLEVFGNLGAFATFHAESRAKCLAAVQ
jgi:hypothetical protein